METTLLLLAAGALLVAWSNGANDNAKGVATLFGSGTLSFRRAIAWATVTTAAGSLCAALLAQGLVRAFSGKGLVPDAVAASPDFLAAVALGAGATVLLATRVGLPISTTHALTGALVGAGTVLARGQVDHAHLASAFLVPLLVSPLVALALGVALYLPLRALRRGLRIEKETCVCVGEFPAPELVPITLSAAAAPAVSATRTLGVRAGAACTPGMRYVGRVVGVDAQTLVDGLHVLSAGAVSFARGLNDAPKIAGLLVALAASGIPAGTGLVAVTVAMAVGGLIGARKVGRTVGHDITSMNHGQGLAANLATALLVLTASRTGLPVSTTHVSCGALFGIGLATRQADGRVIRKVVLSWVATLPIAAALAAAAAWALVRCQDSF